MLRRMVLSDWPSTPWLATMTLFFELLDIKLIQLERRLNFKEYWTLPKAIGDAAKYNGSRAESCFCMFAKSRKLNLISLQHNCILATCCCGDASLREGTTRDWEWRFRVAKSQPHRAVLHYRQGRLQQACTSHLTCFALSLHDTRHTHQVKHRILRILRMQVCIEHQHWANAQLMSCAIHAFAHARLAGMSRELVPGECTQLCLGQNCQA